MNFTNILVVAVIVVIIGSAVYKIISEKKKGRKCIGCPYADNCTSCPSDDYDIK